MGDAYILSSEAIPGPGDSLDLRLQGGSTQAQSRLGTWAATRTTSGKAGLTPSWTQVPCQSWARNPFGRKDSDIAGSKPPLPRGPLSEHNLFRRTIPQTKVCSSRRGNRHAFRIGHRRPRISNTHSSFSNTPRVVIFRHRFPSGMDTGSSGPYMSSVLDPGQRARWIRPVNSKLAPKA